MRVSREKRVAAPAIRHVRVDLGRGEVRVAKHLLNAPEIGSSLQEMRGEGMAQEKIGRASCRERVYSNV